MTVTRRLHLRDTWRHRESGAEAMVTTRTLTSNAHPTVRLELISDPRPLFEAGEEALARSPFPTFTQDYQEMWCCEIGQTSAYLYNGLCPMGHGQAHFRIPLPKRVEPIEIPEAQLQAEWERVEA